MTTVAMLAVGLVCGALVGSIAWYKRTTGASKLAGVKASGPPAPANTVDIPLNPLIALQLGRGAEVRPASQPSRVFRATRVSLAFACFGPPAPHAALGRCGVAHTNRGSCAIHHNQMERRCAGFELQGAASTSAVDYSEVDEDPEALYEDVDGGQQQQEQEQEHHQQQQEAVAAVEMPTSTSVPMTPVRTVEAAVKLPPSVSFSWRCLLRCSHTT